MYIYHTWGKTCFPSHSSAWYVYNIRLIYDVLSSRCLIVDLGWQWRNIPPASENPSWYYVEKVTRPRVDLRPRSWRSFLETVELNCGYQRKQVTYWHDRRSGTLLLLPFYLSPSPAVHDFCIGATGDWPLAVDLSRPRGSELHYLALYERSPVTEVISVNGMHKIK